MGYYRGDYYRGDPGALDVISSMMGRSKTPFSTFGRGSTPEEAAEDMGFPGRALAPPGTSGRKFTRHERATGIEESGGRHRAPRMNVLNVRAARRAIRRLKGFARVARQVYVFTHPAKGRSHFKMPRKRRR